MEKEIRFKCSKDIFTAIQNSADRKGLSVGAYVRMIVMDQLHRAEKEQERSGKF